MGSDSCTSSAAALIRPSFNAVAKAASSTSIPRAVFIRNAPDDNTTHACNNTPSHYPHVISAFIPHVPVELKSRLVI